MQIMELIICKDVVYFIYLSIRQMIMDSGIIHLVDIECVSVCPCHKIIHNFILIDIPSN